MKENKSITFRILERTFGDLSIEAQKKQISVNTLVNQILLEHLEWYGDAPKAGWVPIAKGLASSLLDKFTEEEIIALARESLKYPKEIILLLKAEFNIPNSIMVFESWLRAAGFPYTIDRQEKENKFVIQHHMGRKWSLFWSELFIVVFESLGGKIEAEITDNTFVLKLSIP